MRSGRSGPGNPLKQVCVWQGMVRAAVVALMSGLSEPWLMGSAWYDFRDVAAKDLGRWESLVWEVGFSFDGVTRWSFLESAVLGV